MMQDNYKETADNHKQYDNKETNDMFVVFLTLSVWESCSYVAVVGGPSHVCAQGPIVSYSNMFPGFTFPF